MRNIRVKAASLDNYLSYVTHVSINLVDVNDNSPQFADQNLEFSIVENQTLVADRTLLVGRLHATDLDSGLFGQLEFKLSEDNLPQVLFCFCFIITGLSFYLSFYVQENTLF